MKRIFVTTLILVASAWILFTGCKKYLDAKPDDRLTTPRSVADLQALLDNYFLVNWSGPSSGETSSDDYYLTNADWTALSNDWSRRMYTWQKDYLFQPFPNGWSSVYNVIFVGNTVLDNIDAVKATASMNDWNNTKGQALFNRAMSMFECVCIWSPAYDSSSAATDLGIPIRSNSDFNITSPRSSVKDTYSWIISDLEQSIALLPLAQVHALRPSKPAAYGLLARVYLAMRDYTQAGLYADSCLKLSNRLIDYNTLPTTASYPFTPFNVEIVSDNRRTNDAALVKAVSKIDSTLYNSYAANDLRKTLFFQSNNNGTYAFKGSYSGSQNMHNGICTDEMYLTRAECYARAGDKNLAINDLNTLMLTRWKIGTYIPFTATDAQDALRKILVERRKELLMRGLRWIDIKRLNKEGANITLTRKLDAGISTLLPNDLRYALPIPENVISLSGILQNPR